MSQRRPVIVGLLAALVGLVTLVGALAGCTSGSPAANSGNGANLPAASGLLTAASGSMRAVRSVHFSLTVNGTLSGVPVQSAEGDLNAQGQASGNAKLSTLGQLIQVDFVLVNNTFYIKGPTGGYQKISAGVAGNMFDPSAILDPNRGVAKILASVQNPHTDGQETVNGVDSYRISGKVGKDAVAALVPGVNSDVTSTLWVATATGNLPVKAEFAVPGSDGSQGATVDVVISHVNEPVTVTAPN